MEIWVCDHDLRYHITAVCLCRLTRWSVCRWVEDICEEYGELMMSECDGSRVSLYHLVEE